MDTNNTNNSPAPQNNHHTQQLTPEEEFTPIIPWPEPVKGDELLDAILALLNRFVVLPRWAPETLTLWDVHTFAYQLRDICAYIAVESPEKECGKSTLVTVLSHLVHRPVISSNISSSASFHAVEELNPTLLIDEGDTNLRRNEEFRGILNAGYSKPNAFVWRVAYDTAKKAIENGNGGPAPAAKIENGNGVLAPAAKFKNPKSGGRLARFTCWCPKLIASIGRIHDVLASRCIVISMQRKTDTEQCERTRFLNAIDIRRKCVRFIQDNADAIAAAQPEIPTGLSNRAADIWEPLFVIADLAGGRWPELARQAAIALTANARERNPIGALLLDILVLFKLNKTDRFFSRDLVAALARSTDRPWAELRKGKAIDETWLAKQLRPYGIHPCTIRIGEQRGKGYYFEDFREVFKRYIPRAEFEALYQEVEESGENTKHQTPNSKNPGEAASVDSSSSTATVGGDNGAATCAEKTKLQNSNSKNQKEPPPVDPSSASALGDNGAMTATSGENTKLQTPNSKNPEEPPSVNPSCPGGAGDTTSAEVAAAKNQDANTENSNGAAPTGSEETIKTQNSESKNSEPEICLRCSNPLNPVAPGHERTQSHCNHCGTPLSAPAGTSFREKCPQCGEPQPLHGYNAERAFDSCVKCGSKLPELKYGTRTPWIPN